MFRFVKWALVAIPGGLGAAAAIHFLAGPMPLLTLGLAAGLAAAMVTVATIVTRHLLEPKVIVTLEVEDTVRYPLLFGRVTVRYDLQVSATKKGEVLLEQHYTHERKYPKKFVKGLTLEQWRAIEAELYQEARERVLQDVVLPALQAKFGGRSLPRLRIVELQRALPAPPVSEDMSGSRSYEVSKDG